MRKIKVKDIPKECPLCGGWFTLTLGGVLNYLIVQCLECDYEAKYELLPTCDECKHYTCRYEEWILYEETGETTSVRVDEKCQLHNRSITWDDYCEQWQKKE